MAHPFLDRLRRAPILCDGAMGTQLYARGSEALTHGRCFDELVLSEPALVQAIHRDYIVAGAQIIETNTFGANRIKLATYGLAERTRDINHRAAQLARESREIAGQPVFIAGAIGPSGLTQLTATGPRESERHVDLREVYREQIGALADGGVDLLMLETFSSSAELLQAIAAARDICDLPIVAQATFSEDARTLAGQSPAQVAQTLLDSGVDVLGCNCSVGPAGILDAIEEMRAEARARFGNDAPYLSAQPNAGLPTRIDQRFIYVSTPAYFADYARLFLDAGVRLFGGCCGTTPRHIAAMRAVLEEVAPASSVAHWAPGAAAASPRVSAVRERVAAVDASDTAPAEATAVAPKTRLAATLDAGRFVVSVELDPPKGLNPSKILDGARQLRERGVEFINIADSPMARVRMSCLAMACLVRDAYGVEPIIHFTTRDRNLMALQSDLLGAHTLGIRNILALTGDPLHTGNYPNLTGVWNVDSIGLVEVLRGMNDGHDAAGASLGGSAGFFIGAALNLNMQDAAIDRVQELQRGKLTSLDETSATGDASDLTESDLELRRLRAKLDAGAHFIMTQPIYDLAPFERFVERFGPVRAPVLLGMIPLHSARHAEYLHNEVPGISVPEDVRERMRAAGDHGREVGIELARDIILRARDLGFIQGCYLMPSYGRYDLVGDLAAELLHATDSAAVR